MSPIGPKRIFLFTPLVSVFGGENRHHCDTAKCPLLTLSGQFKRAARGHLWDEVFAVGLISAEKDCLSQTANPPPSPDIILGIGREGESYISVQYATSSHETIKHVSRANQVFAKVFRAPFLASNQLNREGS